jgi:glycosyltransferase involved in cell wall biosynthesis
VRLRILVVHNRYLNSGGEDTSFAAEVALLRGHGHVVHEYVEDNRRIESLGRVRTAVRTIWSSETYSQVRDLIRKHEFELVSVQNWFPLVSPSVYYAARSLGVPVIQTLRNFRLMCVNGLFLRDNRVCEDCLGKTMPWPGILHACYRDSHAASAVVAGTLAVHRVLGTWRGKVDAYVALNDFVRDKYISGGLPAGRLVVKPNFLSEDPGVGSDSGSYALFVGRLSPEKGVDTIVDAWGVLGARAPHLKIVGEGPDAAALTERAAGQSSIEFIGAQSNAEVLKLMKVARTLIVASRCYENFPRVILEALACGLPIVAPRLGAMASLVRDRKTGLLFEPGSAQDLADCVSWIQSHPTERGAMASEARRDYLEHYTAEANYRAFEEIWKRIIH